MLTRGASSCRKVLASVGAAAAVAVAWSLAGPVAPAGAAGGGNQPPIIVTPGGGGTVGIDVRAPGRPGRNGGTNDGGQANTVADTPAVDPCSINPSGRACAASDPAIYCYVWGSAFLQAGLPPTGLGPLLQSVGCAPTLPVVTPAMLAQRAYSLLRLPKPTIERSPLATNSDQGRPYTWVNLWTWFWTDPVTFTPRSRTASAGAISATATATPIALVYDPGTGDTPVTCPGPGRPWQASDGDFAPSGGGCGYTYLHVSDSVTATVTIQWQVTWTGSNGQTGTLPVLLTSASSSFMVQQIQAVNR